jgi:hypothetical protein
VKALLKISILLNLALIGCLVWILQGRTETNPKPLPPVSDDTSQQRAAAPAPPVQAASKPFRWSQLESTDYRTYIANLRGIGCPEQTIRDLITADLDGLYAPKRDALQRKLASADASVAGAVAKHDSEAALETLQTEESATLATLLGPVPSAIQVASDTAPSSAPATQRTAAAAPVSLPLVFQDIDPGAVSLNERQIRAINDLKQSFVDQVGGPNQDPNDPGYRERWLKAQPEIDANLRGIIGVNAFQDYQVAVHARQQAGAGN